VGVSVDGDLSPRQTAGPPCPDDYVKFVAVTSDVLSLSSLKVHAEHNARTGRDYCCVRLKGTWGGGGGMWAHFGRSGREAKFCNYFRMSVDS
jgi:hypothetical protein